MHIGLDTVELKGQHFDLKVKRGQEVAAGDVLVEFDIEAIRAAGYSMVTPVIITNSAKHVIVGEPATGPINHGDPLFYAEAVQPAVAAN